MTSPIRSAPSSDKPRFVGEWVRLGDVCEIRSGGTPKRSVPEYWKGGSIPWVKIGDISGKYIDSTEEYITEAGLKNSAARILEPGVILFSIFASIGAVGILRIPASTNQAVASLAIVSDAIDRDYLFYFLKSREVAVKSSGRGVAQNNINLSILRSMQVPIPELAIQRKIAEQIEAVSAQIEASEIQLGSLDSLIKSRFVEMFGDPCDPANDSFPREPIDSFCELRTGPFGSSLHKEDYVSGGHPIVNPSHITESKIEIDSDLTIDGDAYAALTPYHLNIGDVVMGRRGEIGRCAVVAKTGLVCGTGSMILRPNPNRCHSDFLQRVISFPSFALALEREAVGVTMKNLNAKIVGNATVILPPIKLQQDFDAFVAQANKLRFAGNHEMNFRCERFTLSWSTMA